MTIHERTELDNDAFEISYPENISANDVLHMAEWFELCLRRIRRRATPEPKFDPTKNIVTNAT